MSNNETRNMWQSIIESCTQVKAEGYFTAKTPGGELVLCFYNLEAGVCMMCVVDVEHLSEFLEKNL